MSDNDKWNGHIWEGIYDSFDQVPVTGLGFMGDDWIERSRQ